MNRSLSLLALASALALTAGCNRAEDQSQVARDVAEARQEAAENNAEASRDAAEEIRDAAQDSGPASADAREATVEGQKDIAIAQAEGRHKVATEGCDALKGEAQQACKDRADAELDAAKADAKQSAAATQQQNR
jgi:hypothetical protein